MLYTRHFWYDFFSELGFLIMPCGFNWKSTTSWLFEGGVENEIALKDEMFQITYTGIHCFFYHLNETLLKQHLALFRLTDTVIRHKLADKKISLDIPSRYHEYPLPNIRKYEGKKYLQGFSLREYAYMISAITAQIDPMDWQKEGVLTPDYPGDFDTYGFCFLSITKLPVSTKD
jgi:hypothetical protein